MKVYNTYFKRLSAESSKFNHMNLNWTYNVFRKPLKGFWQINNAKLHIIKYGFNPNLYFKARATSPAYSRNKKKSAESFKKIGVNPKSNFYKAIASTPSKSCGASRNSYKKFKHMKTQKKAMLFVENVMAD